MFNTDDMTTEKQIKKSRDEIAIDMVSGVAAALTYSNEEIYDTFSAEDAEEFIQLREEVKQNMEHRLPDINIGYSCDDNDFSLAAEDEAEYGQ